MNMTIACPYARDNIKHSLECLLDTELQKNWFNPTAKHRFWDSLDYYIFDYLFNDADLIDEAEEAIGISLYNKEEAGIISKYLNFFNDTFKGDMPDFYYINHPKWHEVIEGAREIVEIMEKNNKKYNIEEDIKAYEQEERLKRETEIGAMVDEAAGFSPEERQSLKNQMFSCSDDEFIEVTNGIINKLMLAKSSN